MYLQCNNKIANNEILGLQLTLHLPICNSPFNFSQTLKEILKKFVR